MTTPPRANDMTTHCALREVLVPLDGSSLAESALAAALPIANGCDSHITLLHVIEQAAPSTIHGDTHLNDSTEASSYLARIAESVPGAEIHVHPNPEGDVARSIADHAAEFGSDLIVLCAHGEGGASSWLTGTKAQQIIRRAAPPVLLVRESAVAPFSPTGIIVALDLAAHGDAALQPSVAIARALQLPITLLAVVPTKATLGTLQATTALFSPSASTAALELEHQAAVARLREVAESLGASGLTVRAEVLRGEALKQVAEHAAKNPAAVLAVATHGKTGMDAFWSESVGSRVVGRVTNPLLLVHPVD